MKNAVRAAFAERFTQALNEAGYRDMPLHKIGAEFGVSAQAVRKWMTAESLPTSARAALVAEKLGIRRVWLLDGEEPMRARTASIGEDLTPYGTLRHTEAFSLSAEEFELLRHYRNLSRTAQESIKSLLQEIARPRA